MKSLFILTSALLFTANVLAENDPLWMRYPAISPNGETIAFTYKGDIYTVPVNIAGIPAISLPCGKTDSGLPIGMQLIGNHFTEALLYRAANAFENESGISGRSFATV